MPLLSKVVSFDYNKHLPQSSSEKTSDLFFLVTALFIANSKDKEITKLTLQKTLFQSVQSLAAKDISFLNTFFFINTYGPFNNIFYQYMEGLEQADLVKTEGKTIDLTAKGLRVVSDLLSEISQDTEMQTVLLDLEQRVERYAGDPTKAINETHALRVIDTTNNQKVKTIKELIKELNPEQKFITGTQFKYIEPNKKPSKRVQAPAKTINELEEILAKVEPSDYEKTSDLSLLFS
ncbi:hypothetical protein HYU93_01560 [Candidatus Daviesbacteria bacterium]|nr:hypothetical protein [Candidatus Daviesbacteria bacterium]